MTHLRLNPYTTRAQESRGSTLVTANSPHPDFAAWHFHTRMHIHKSSFSHEAKMQFYEENLSSQILVQMLLGLILSFDLLMSFAHSSLFYNDHTEVACISPGPSHPENLNRCPSIPACPTHQRQLYGGPTLKNINGIFSNWSISKA